MGKTKKIVAIIAIVIAFGLIAFAIYNLTMSNKTKMINILYNYFTDEIKMEEEDIESSKITTDTNITNVDSNGKTKTYSLSGDIYQDFSKKQTYMKLLVDIGNVALNMETYGEKSDYYFKIKEVKDVFYKIIVKADSVKYSEEEMKKLLDVLRGVLKDSLKEKDFSKSKERINIGGSEYNTTKYTMSISYQSLYDIFKALFDNENDSAIIKEFLSILKSDSKTEFLSSLKESIKGNESKELFSYSIYVKSGNDILKHEFSLPIELEELGGQSTSLVISIVGAETDKDLDIFEINLSVMANKLFDFSVIEVSEGKYDIKGSLSTSGMSINGNYIENNGNIDFSIYAMDETGGRMLEATAVVKEIAKDKEYTLDLNLAFKSGVSVVSKNTITKGIAIPTVDVSNAIDYNTLSEKEKSVFEELFTSFLMQVTNKGL